jgi:hypothetical protein
MEPSEKVEYRAIEKRNTGWSKKGIQSDQKMEYSVVPKENTGWSKNGIQGGSQKE